MSSHDPYPFTHADQALIAVDAAGRITWSNEAAQAQGLTPPAGSLRDLLPPNEVEQLLDARTPLTVRISPTLSAAEKTASRRQPPAECLVVPLTTGASTSGALLVFAPHSAEIASLFQREEFLATVAHDLKNPLGALFSYADALLDTSIGDGLNEKQRHMIGRMRATALRSIDLVRNYQQLSQLRAGALPTPAAPVDLNTIVSTILEYCWRPEVGGAALALDLDRAGAPVFVERLPLERIVANIFSNAVKYTPPGGSIAVRTERLPSGGRISISNTGPGITAEERDSIFIRFKRGSAAAGTTGSGLGLYIVKTVLDGIGGQIALDSAPNGITVFTVTFPR